MSNSKFTDLVKEAKSHTHQFTLWPDRWRVCNLKVSWNTYAFSEESVSSIPKNPGVYAFLIQPGIAGDLNTSYLIYIGMSKNLRRRFVKYLREFKSKIGRPKIVSWLFPYIGYLHFSYTLVNPSNTLKSLEDNLKSLEDELIKAFIPPANDRFPAEVRRVVKAFR